MTGRARVKVAFEPPAPRSDRRSARLASELLSGLPLRNYHSDVPLETLEVCARIRWVSTFDGAYPGVVTIIQLVLAQFIPEIARRLAPTAESTG